MTPEQTRLERELQSSKCFCGAKKAMMQTFCRPHYSSLPDWMRARLYQRFGDGYEEAYAAARKELEEKKGHTAEIGTGEALPFDPTPRADKSLDDYQDQLKAKKNRKG